MIWGLIAGSRLGRWAAMVGGALALLAGAVVLGWTKRGQAEATKALKGYKKTRKDVDHEDYIDPDINVARDRLRERGKR